MRETGASLPSLLGKADPGGVRLQLHTVRTLVSQLLTEKMRADAAMDADITKGPGCRQTLSEFVYDFFVAKLRSPTMARVHLAAFVEGVARFQPQDPAVHMFARLVGAPGVETIPDEAAVFVVNVQNLVYQVYALIFPLIGSHSRYMLSSLL